jgi:hypothetical protein
LNATPRLVRGSRNLKPALGIRWVIDPRTPVPLLQALVCLGPGWWLVGILNPMAQGGLVTPLGETRHYAVMDA